MDTPEQIITLLKEHGFGDAKLLFCAESDRAAEDGFAQGYVLLAEESLFFIRNKTKTARREYRGYFAQQGFFARFKKPVEAGDAQEPEYELTEFKIKDIDKLYIINLVAAGLLILKSGENERTLCAFSAGLMKDISTLTSLFGKLKEKGKLEEADLDFDKEETVCPKCGMAYPEPDRKICPRCMKKGAIFVRLLKLSLQYRAAITAIIALMVFSSALGLALPYLQGKVLFDWAIHTKDGYLGRLLLVLGAIFACATLSMAAGTVLGVINAKLTANIIKDLKIRVFSSMQRLSLSFFQKKQTGHLMSRVNNDSADLQYFFIDGMPYLIVNGLNAVGILTIMLIINWKLTILCMIPAPLLLLYVFNVFPKLYRLNWLRFIRSSKMTSLISDSFKGSRVVKAFGKEDREITRFGKSNVSFAQSQIAEGQLVQTVFPLMALIMQGGGYIVWALGGWNVMYHIGGFTLGDLMTFLNYIFMIYGPIRWLCNMSEWWSYCMSAAQRIFEIVDAVPDITEKPDAVPVGRMEGRLSVESITFGYEPNKPVLKEVSMTAQPGKMIGIVGHSGAGKSTLVNLVTRLYDISEGSIKIDGVDIRDMRIADLRRNIGIVSQEVYVFMGTVAENIAYARPGCSREEIITAAKIANAHDFIEHLPEGYDTMVGPGGHDLSGGEKQRVSIARAVLLDPRILILDEATASLDTQSERQIQEGIEMLSKGRTTIAIAHRLSTLRNADVLFVLENGKVAESGSHAELLKSQGIYFRLFKKQNEALSLKALAEN